MSGLSFVDRADRKARPDWLLISDPQLQTSGASSNNNNEAKKQYRFNGEYGEKMVEVRDPRLAYKTPNTRITGKRALITEFKIVRYNTSILSAEEQKVETGEMSSYGGSLGIARVVYDASEKHGKHRSLAAFVAEKANGHLLRGQSISVQVDLTGEKLRQTVETALAEKDTDMEFPHQLMIHTNLQY
ncbi:hypothetical protein BDF22DRAFT_653211 [Syncephalis plumigaleata]|nr:hypothetical protein BDF22DRAFT_653211 [Syncephalis plumigaleata]